MSTTVPARTLSRADARVIALKYLTVGLVLGLFLAPRAGAETWARFLSGWRDLFGGVGMDEFSEPMP